MYCKHCYRMIEDGTDICPACGKSQTEQVTPNPKSIKKAKWYLLSFIAALCCIKLSPLLSVVFFGLAIYFSISLLKDKKAAQNAPIHDRFTATSISRPMIPDESTGNIDTELKNATPKATAEAVKPKVEQETVNIILESLRQDTFHETLQELYGDGKVEDAPIEVDQEAVEPAKPRPVSKLDTNPVVGVTHKVIGIPHYIDNIMKLAVENTDYDMSKREIVDCGMTDERIWKYDFYPTKTELVPEPDNPVDEKAIKVIVDGQHVGYIKKGSCARVLKAINENKIRGISCTIGGGPYKIVEENDDYDDTSYSLYRESTNYFVTLTVYETKQ